ncbi:MAG: recombination regulator RecX [Salinisphaera sp.]|nr:recombination regulator RecX [Salinisphaera sp.]
MTEPAGELRARALRLLARREHAASELARKLVGRGFDRAAVDEVLAQLAAEGLLDENRYAEALVRSRAEHGYGPLRIRAELAARGVEAGVVAAALDATQVNWRELAAAARRKRFGPEPPADLRARAKQLRFLQRRGFDGADIRAVVHV